MPYDWAEEKARQISPIYGSPPGGVSRDQVASEDAARRFARRRLLMGLQGGFGAGVEAGGGFFGNLTRGFAGSLGGTLRAGQMQHEEERQSIKDTADMQRQANEDAYRQRTESRAIGAESRAIEDQNWQRSERLGPGRSGYQATPWWLAPGVDPGMRAKAEADAFRAPQGSQPTERDKKIEDWRRIPGNEKKTRGDYVKEVELGGRRTGTKGKRQANDMRGRPMVDPNGNPVWLQYESQGVYGSDDDPLNDFYGNP